MSFLKKTSSKVIGIVATGAVIFVGITIYQMPTATKHAILANLVKILAWLAVVGLVPWITFSIIGWVARFERNSAGFALVAVYTAIEFGLLMWLFGSTHGTTVWIVIIVGVLLAAAYNLLACDWIAEKWS